MLIEVHHHQTAREKTIQEPFPAKPGGKQPLLVEQNELVRFRAEEIDSGLAENVGADHEPVPRRPLFKEPLGIGERFQRAPDQRPSTIARDMRQRPERRRSDGCEGIAGVDCQSRQRCLRYFLWKRILAAGGTRG